MRYGSVQIPARMTRMSAISPTKVTQTPNSGFPIPFDEEEFNLSTCPMARYLHFRIQRTRLWTGELYKPKNSFRTILHTASMLMNQENGRWAGVLQLHWDGMGGLTSQLNDQIELIALSKGSTTLPTIAFQYYKGFEMDETLEMEESYHFYYVMWIEWDNGIAYRKAIGRVPQVIWEHHELEWIDVTLG
jgi:hypothetical protein